jgi:hypothetical protein
MNARCSQSPERSGSVVALTIVGDPVCSYPNDRCFWPGAWKTLSLVRRRVPLVFLLACLGFVWGRETGSRFCRTALNAKPKVHRRDVWYTSTCDAALAIGSHGMVYGVARNFECQPTPQSNQCVWGPVASGIVEAPTLPCVLGSHFRASCNLQQGIDLSCCAVHRSCVSGCGGCLHCFIVCCVSWVLADSLLVTYHAAPCPSES